MNIKMKWSPRRGVKYLGALACGAWALGGGAPQGTWGARCIPGGIVAARAQSAVAMVIGVRGSPQLVVGSTTTKLRLGARLAGGQIVKCPPNSEATIVLFLSGKRFRVASGASAKVSSDNVTGASALGTAGKVSTLVAKTLAGSRTGSVVSRTLGGYGNFSLLPPLDTASVNASVNAGGNAGANLSRPELGFLSEGTTTIIVPWQPATQMALFTLYDSESDVAYSKRLSTPRVELPGDFTPRLRRSYVWSVVPFSGTSLSSPTELKRETPQWGMVTWLSPEDARLVGGAIGAGSLESLSKDDDKNDGKNDGVAATLVAGLLSEHKVNGGAWKLLSTSRNNKLEGAEDAFYEFYESTPRIAQFFSGYSGEYSAWKSKQ